MKISTIAQGTEYEHILISTDSGASEISVMEERDGSLLVSQQIEGEEVILCRIAPTHP